MMKDMPDLPFVSVIIPTYNRGKLLALTLDSFLNQSYPSERYEIIVSNNNSTDITEDVLAGYCTNHSNVKPIFEGRQGVHYARNSAAKIAKGDIFYFTDDDMIADKDLIKELVKVFAFDQKIGCATGMIKGKFNVEPPKWVKKHMINYHLSLTDGTRQEDLIITPNDLVYSCHQAILRNVFFSAGGFNPENTMGFWIGDGETGLNIKVKNNGYKFAYTSKSIIYHIIPENRTNLKYLIQRFSNYGFSDSYTEYRKHRDKSKILPSLIKRSTRKCFTAMGLILIKICLGKCSWHFIPANIMYFHKRNVYDLKMYRNESFRKLVEIDDWINNDSIIKF
jgi:glucosyl-dolichyl phosphate glucuronosyltransferase